MTTYRSFVDALEALAVTGVVKVFTEGPPKALNTAELPAQYVRLPRGENGDPVFGEFSGTFSTYVADLVICVNAVGQGEGPFNNFDATVDMMDDLHSALGDVTSCGVISAAAHTWTIRQTVDTVAGNDYWAVIATVTGRG